MTLFLNQELKLLQDRSKLKILVDWYGWREMYLPSTVTVLVRVDSCSFETPREVNNIINCDNNWLSFPVSRSRWIISRFWVVILNQWVSRFKCKKCMVTPDTRYNRIQQSEIPVKLYPKVCFICVNSVQYDVVVIGMKRIHANPGVTKLITSWSGVRGNRGTFLPYNITFLFCGGGGGGYDNARNSNFTKFTFYCQFHIHSLTAKCSYYGKHEELDKYISYR